MVAPRVLDLRKLDLVLSAKTADRIGEVGAGSVIDPADGRGEVDSSAPGWFRPGKLKDAPVDRHAAEPQLNERGERLIWIEEPWLDKLNSIRRSGERHSEAVIRLAALWEGHRGSQAIPDGNPGRRGRSDKGYLFIRDPWGRMGIAFSRRGDVDLGAVSVEKSRSPTASGGRHHQRRRP
jgi:hypothetical protein